MSDSSISNSSVLGGADGDMPSDNGKDNNGNSSNRKRPAPSESEPENCSICLSTITDMCTTNVCRHQFCFTCLSTWASMNRARCPLCKQHFTRIRHNFRGDNEYDEHPVRRIPSPVPVDFPSWLFSDNHGSQQNEHYNLRSARWHRPRENQNLAEPQVPPAARPNAHVAAQIPAPVAPQYAPTLTNALGGVSTSAGLSEPQHPNNNPSDSVSSRTEPAQQDFAQIPGHENIREQNEQYQRPENIDTTPRNVPTGAGVSRDYLRRHPGTESRIRDWVQEQATILRRDWTNSHRTNVVAVIMVLIGCDVTSEFFRNSIWSYFGENSALFQRKLYHFMVAIEPYDSNIRTPVPSHSAERQNARPEVVTLSDEEENATINEYAAADGYPGNLLVNTVSARRMGNHSFDLALGSNVLTPDTRSIGLSYEREGESDWSQQLPNADPEMPFLNSRLRPIGSLNIADDDDNSAVTVSIAGPRGATTTVTTSSNSEISRDNLVIPSALGTFNERDWNNETIRISGPELEINLRSFSPTTQTNGPMSIPDFPITQPPSTIRNTDRSIGERSDGLPIEGFDGFSFDRFMNDNESMRSNLVEQDNFNALVPSVSSQLVEPPEQSNPSSSSSSSLPSSSTSSSSEDNPSFLNSYAGDTGSSSTMSTGSSTSAISSLDAISSSSSSSSTPGTSTSQMRRHTVANADNNDSDSDSSEVIYLGSFPIHNQSHTTHESENLPVSDQRESDSNDEIRRPDAMNGENSSDTESYNLEEISSPSALDSLALALSPSTNDYSYGPTFESYTYGDSSP